MSIAMATLENHQASVLTCSQQSLEGRLLFAVPKKGRLLKASLDFLQGADIQFHRENRLDIALVKNLPIALIFLPAADIPTFVGEGRVDLGITGLDQVQEHNAAVRATSAAAATAATSGDSPADTSCNGNGTTQKAHHHHQRGCQTVMELGFGACRLQVQVPAEGEYAQGKDLIGKNIGTSFEFLAREYFARLEREEAAADGGKSSGSSNGSVDDQDLAAGHQQEELRTKIIKLSGSVEAACALGVADGIIDLVESGETMRAAGLKPIDTVMESLAILVKSRSPRNPAMVDLIASRISGFITAQRYVLCQYNIERARLPEAVRITPGKRAPTITSLEEEGWIAISAMVERKRVAGVMDELVGAGATDILVLDIHNTRGS